MTQTRRVPHTIVLPVRMDGTPPTAIERAAELLREGGLVAFPTETVYGLGADATNPDAVSAIFTAKDRPYSDPIIVHLATVERLPEVAHRLPEVALRLAERFWPGPLTLVLPRAPLIPAVVAAGGDTVGVRVPSHPVARALLQAARIPVAAPSANRFMHTSPTTADHVLADLEGRIDCVLDGGPTLVGVESTVVDVTVSPPRILRPGGVTLEALRQIVPEMRAPEAAGEHVTAEAAIARAPGQMDRHYAPRARLLAFDGPAERVLTALREEAMRALESGMRVGALLPDEDLALLRDLPLAVASLGSTHDPAEMARRLYAALRALDGQHLDLILTRMVAETGMGLALRDRLRRAAGGNIRHV